MTVSFLEIIAKREQEETAPEKGVLNDLLMVYSLGLCACLCAQSHQLQRGACVCSSRSGGLGLHVAFSCARACLPCSPLCTHTHPHKNTPPLWVLSASCSSCLPQFIPPALSPRSCLCMKFSRLQRTFSLSLSVCCFVSLQNEVITDPVSHQCWLTAYLYLCCCNCSGIAVVGHCGSLQGTDCFSLVGLGYNSLNSPITAAYLFHNGLIINAHHVTSWITCFRGS